jgi:PAS domain S-box-containing protein
VSDPLLTALQILAGACLMPACVYLWMWYRNDRNPEYGWTALLGVGCAGYVTCSVLEYQASGLPEYLSVYRPQPLFTSLVLVSMLELAHALHPHPRLRHAVATHGFALLWTLVGVIRLFDQEWIGRIKGIYTSPLQWGLGHIQLLDLEANSIGKLLIVCYLAGIAVAAWSIWSARRTGADSFQARFLSYSLVVLFICFLHDFLAVTLRFPWPYLAEPGFFLISILLGSSLLRDVLRSQAVRAELKARQETFQILFHQNPHACLITRASNGEILLANRRFLDILGAPSSELVVGKTTLDIGMWGSDGVRRMERLKDPGPLGLANLRTYMRRMDGTPFHVSHSIQSIEYEGIPAFLGLLEDVDLQTRAEEALRESETRYRELASNLERRVEERTSEIEAFNYMVSHDLRAPLRGIDGFARALAEDHSAQLDDPGREVLRRIRQAARRMSDLIDALLFFSRSAKVPLSPRETDIASIAHEILSRFQDLEKDRRVTWTLGENLKVWGDPGLLRSVMENLLGNAWKYTSRTQAGRIDVERETIDGQEWIAVRDNGIGFDMRHAGQLFGTFQRLDQNDFPGTGIGLATVKRIVSRHGGDVAAEGESGKGAVFRFHLGEKLPR